MTNHYRMDAGKSRFTAQAFVGGLLSMMGHSPTFAVRDYEGDLRWAPDAAADASLEVTASACSLELLDNVRPADREEIEGRMRKEVLEVAAYPEIRFQASAIASTPVGGNRYRLRIAGLMTLHGVTQHHAFEVDLLYFDDGVRLAGEFPLKLSDYRIRPVTALGGAIKLQDPLKLSFDIAAWKEAS